MTDRPSGSLVRCLLWAVPTSLVLWGLIVAAGLTARLVVTPAFDALRGALSSYSTH